MEGAAIGRLRGVFDKVRCVGFLGLAQPLVLFNSDDDYRRLALPG